MCFDRKINGNKDGKIFWEVWLMSCVTVRETHFSENFICWLYHYHFSYLELKFLFQYLVCVHTLKLRAVDRSTIQFWTLCAKASNLPLINSLKMFGCASNQDNTWWYQCSYASLTLCKKASIPYYPVMKTGSR